MEEKRILWNISGKASHGRVLAVLGPSGELVGRYVVVRL